MRFRALSLLVVAGLAASPPTAKTAPLENAGFKLAPGVAQQICIEVQSRHDRYVLSVTAYEPIPGGGKISVREAGPDGRSDTPLTVLGMFPDRSFKNQERPRRFLLPPTSAGNTKPGSLKCFSVQLDGAKNGNGHATVSLGQAKD